MRKKVLLSLGVAIAVFGLVSVMSLNQHVETKSVAETLPIGPFVMYKG
ncbi:hypothetical protein [Tumebacillus avium]|nr:hypothetical protein [Tumebacillus avium]